MKGNNLSVFDDPGGGIAKNDAIQKQLAEGGITRLLFSFETFLVVGKKAYFRLHWYRELNFANGKWDTKDDKVISQTSEPLDGVPLVDLGKGYYARNKGGDFLSVYFSSRELGKAETPLEPFFFDLSK